MRHPNTTGRWNVLLMCAAGLVLVGPALPAYGLNLAPRIVSATMVDRDGDDRADSVRLRYSERIWHARDADGSYPFKVGTYGIRSVNRTRGTRTLTILLRERARKDIGARPSVSYGATRSEPVRDSGGKQAATQTFRGAVPLDKDGDGYAVADCAPVDRAVHPGAPDAPDLAFLDSNCDRIDGDRTRAIFVSPDGLDANTGSSSAPLRTVAEALRRAALTPLDEDVYLATGEFREMTTLPLHAGSGIYGGYSAATWARSSTRSKVLGAREAMFAGADLDVTLQLLEVTSAPGQLNGQSSTVLTLDDGSGVRLERVTLRAGAGGAGSSGTVGADGTRGQAGNPGRTGVCDAGSSGAPGGAPVGTGNAAGGAGGRGGAEGANAGQPGLAGAGGSLGGGTGGTGGAGGDPGRAGQSGGRGVDGAAGGDGVSRNGVFFRNYWLVGSGEAGYVGVQGYGGGGGGGGGGQGGVLVDDGVGNGGGGGGEGGLPGRGATPGQGGGASIAASVGRSSLTLVSSSLIAADGGRGGGGATGGFGGPGGNGGAGGTNCTSEIGAGGDGGPGGRGGRGGASGGGQGGPSIAVVSFTSTITKDPATTLTHGTPGAGGFSPAAGAASDGAAGIAATMYTVPGT